MNANNNNNQIIYDDLVKRKPNFTDGENLFLLSQIENFKVSLINRSIDHTSNKVKDQVWQRIADTVNERNPMVFRSSLDLKKKWKNMVTTARRSVKDVERSIGCFHFDELPPLQRRILEINSMDSGSSITYDGADESSTSPLMETGQVTMGSLDGQQNDMNLFIKKEDVDETIEQASYTAPQQLIMDRSATVAGTSFTSGFTFSTTPIYPGIKIGPPVIPVTSKRMGTVDAYFSECHSPGVSSLSTQSINHPHNVNGVPPKMPRLNVNPSIPSGQAISEINTSSLPVQSHRPTTSFNANSTIPSKISYEEEIAREKWNLERQKLELDLIQQRERWEWERRKLQLETEILTMQRQKIDLQIHREKQGL